MRYELLKEKTINLPVISLNYLHLLEDNSKTFANQISYWLKKQKLLNLRKGLYLLNDIDRKINVSRMFLSNQIYYPSYISMEYALSYYGLIPEKVVVLTNISTKKTAVFENILGVFKYQHVLPKAFTGFLELKDESGYSFYIATPEKAVVDFVYQNLDKFKQEKDFIRKVLFDSFRFQNIDILDTKKLIDYANLFENKKLIKIVKEVKND